MSDFLEKMYKNIPNHPKQKYRVRQKREMSLIDCFSCQSIVLLQISLTLFILLHMCIK